MKIVAVTACISGIAHTYLSAEALESAGKALGHQIKVETRGSIGAENVLTEKEIREAQVVIIAADLSIPKERFKGKPVYEAGTHEVVNKAGEIIQKALKFAENYQPGKEAAAAPKAVKTEPAENQGAGGKSVIWSEIYRHLMCGISYLIPFVVSGGIIMALSFAFAESNPEIAGILGTIGDLAFGMMLPIMAGFIAQSIADRPGLVPGIVGGFLASGATASGFIGGVLAGFIAGYSVQLLKKVFRFKGGLRAMMPILILPLFSTLITGLIMLFVIGKPVAIVNDFLTNWLNSLSGGSAVVLGFIVAAMIAVDLGGVFCRVGYAFAVATLATGQPSVAMAAAMAGGLVPSTAIALATVLMPHKFTDDEIEAGKGCWVLGASFIVEGVIPFAARDIKAVVPAVTLGAGVTGALTAFFGCTQSVPHGGIWVMPVPGAIGNVPMYLLSVAVGIAVTVGLTAVLKKDVSPKLSRAQRKAQKAEVFQ
ncbi:MAG: fructose system or component [Clostridiales bacterium]|nr:fructose system or component [Clostridiales bacterium]MDN5297665.1 fructose system or component [Clostridiales bacterium]